MGENAVSVALQAHRYANAPRPALQQLLAIQGLEPPYVLLGEKSLGVVVLGQGSRNAPGGRANVEVVIPGKVCPPATRTKPCRAEGHLRLVKPVVTVGDHRGRSSFDRRDGEAVEVNGPAHFAREGALSHTLSPMRMDLSSGRKITSWHSPRVPINTRRSPSRRQRLLLS